MADELTIIKTMKVKRTSRGLLLIAFPKFYTNLIANISDGDTLEMSYSPKDPQTLRLKFIGQENNQNARPKFTPGKL